MRLGLIALDQIDREDRRFEIPFFGDTSRLDESLARFGILDPPRVLPKNGSFVIVDGFKRLRWARENGVREAACLHLPDGLSSRDIWERRIEKKLFEGTPDIAEKAKMAAVLIELYPRGDAPEPLSRALGISPRRGMLARWTRIWKGGPEVLKILATGEIAERAALEACEWEPESRVEVLETLCALRCSASIQVEIIEHITEIAIREEKSRLDILRNPEVREILTGTDLNHREKTRRLRDLLRRLRYPRLSQRERRFRMDIESLSLPPSVRLIPPPGFEGEAWKLELSFSGPDELAGTLKAAGELAGPGGLDRAIMDPNACLGREEPD